MIDVALARTLRDSGLRWHPLPGDRFVIDRPGAAEAEFDVGDGFDDEVFTISDMTIEAHEYSTGTILGFNGTTEWALDSVAATDSLWLPREDQLRILLAASFRSLGVVDGRYVVTITLDGAPATFSDVDAERAYGLALDAYIRASLSLESGPSLEGEAASA